jgi:hypothetical protein
MRALPTDSFVYFGDTAVGKTAFPGAFGTAGVTAGVAAGVVAAGVAAALVPCYIALAAVV